MITEIAKLIKIELDRFPGETLANQLRCAAWFAHEDFPKATSSDFADAAVSLGLHRQGAMNRWNEGIKNLKELEAFEAPQ